jgi:hypothetical protein
MRWIFTALLLVSGEALAQSQMEQVARQGTGCPSGTNPCWVGVASAGKPLAGGQYGLSTTTSVGLTLPAGAAFAQITVEGQSIRLRDDGTAPTSSVGQGPFSPGSILVLKGASLGAVRMIGVAAGGTINVAYYQ